MLHQGPGLASVSKCALASLLEPDGLNEGGATNQ